MILFLSKLEDKYQRKKERKIEGRMGLNGQERNKYHNKENFVYN